MSTPPVSVVLPFRDAAATLGAALDSLRSQTLADFECLLVDDGSRDASPALAAACAAADPRFRVIEAGGGLVDALNRGIAAARAPLVARMDADDLAHRERLARQCERLARDASLSAVGCLVECFPVDAAGAGMRRYVEWLNGVVSCEAIRDAIFVESPIAHPSAVLRRTALDAVGGYRHGDGPEDYDLWLRLVLDGHRLAKVPEMLLSWRDSPGRLSRVDRRYERRRFLATKLAHFPRAVPPTTRLQIWGAGPTGRAWARGLRQHGYTIGCFIDIAPQRWGRRLAGVPVEQPRAPDRRDGFVLIAVGTPGARAWIEAWLAQHDLRPWRDYLAVA
ncbi:MAG: glycosyltransferase [Deltaproteobacteria bacterium]|nr:glycosyltransferase [Deltaproteobacteria bacterium]